MLAASLTAAGADINIDGITYSTKGNATATCRATNPKDPAFTEADIKPSVMIDGQPYTVNRVEKEGFRRCRHLRSVTLPNTIKRIGMDAFADCSELQSIVLPDASQVDIPGRDLRLRRQRPRLPAARSSPTCAATPLNTRPTCSTRHSASATTCRLPPGSRR